MSAEAAQRLARAHAACDLLLDGRPLTTTLNELTQNLRHCLGADLIAVDLPSPAGRLRAIAPAVDSPEWAKALQSVGLGSGSPVAVDSDQPHGPVPMPAEFEPLGVTSLLAFPLRGRQGAGVLWLGFPADRACTLGELACLDVLAAELSLRLERALETVGPASGPGSGPGSRPGDAQPPSRPRESERGAQVTEELIGMAVHEIRTPLTPLTMLLHSLERKAKSGVTDIEAVSRARRQVDRLTQMVSDLLDLSRLGRGKLELRSDSVDVVAALRGAAQKFRDARGAERIEIPDVAGEVLVIADAHRLGATLHSLIEHVAHVSPSSRAVALAFEVKDGAALVCIRSAAPAATGDRPTPTPEPTRSPSTQAERLKGIAAHLAEALIRRQGGSVVADDDRGGVRLRLTFPLAPPDGLPAPSADGGPPTVASGRGGQ